jgi:hypothetical protein
MIFIPKENRDLRIYVLKKDLLRLIGFATWMALWYAATEFYNNSHQSYTIAGRLEGKRFWFWIGAAALIGFFMFRMWKLVTDVPFRGTVKENGNSRTYSGSEDPGATSRLDYDFRIKTRLKIKGRWGLPRRIRFEQKDGFFSYYHEGEQIVHLHGLPYPINLDPTGKHGYVCAACGTWHQEKTKHCTVCRHTMIDPTKLTKTK